MIPAQRSSVSAWRWFGFSAIVAGVQAWVRSELVADDPWDDVTLYPDVLPEAKVAGLLSPEEHRDGGHERVRD
jgi:hypothetical protein